MHRPKSIVRFGFSALCLAVLLTLIPALAAPADAAARKRTRIVRQLPPSPEKDAAIVVDGATGKVVYSRNPDALRYPASLTKMMTLYLLFEALDKGALGLETSLVASAYAAGQPPTKVSVKAGGTIDVDTAIKALAVLSANDVAVVVAESLGGSETAFAGMMTAKAHRLGMRDTFFANASGLPNPDQITTARDMAVLGRHLAYDFPQFYHYFTTTSFTYRGAAYRTHNNLIAAFEGSDGIKTGYTRLSGFNLVTSAVRGNKHVVGVVLGGSSAGARDREMMRLLSATFDMANEYPTSIADANPPWKGGSGPKGDLYKPYPGEETLLASLLEHRAPAKRTIIPQTPTPQARVEMAMVPVSKTGLSSHFESLKLAMLAPLLTPAEKPADADEAPPREVPPPDLGPLVDLELQLAFDPPPTFEPIAQAEAAAAKRGMAKDWTVQIGVFATETLAETRLAAVARGAGTVVRDAEKLVEPFPSMGGKIFYRASFGSFAEAQARTICKTISKRGQTCFAAPPG